MKNLIFLLLLLTLGCNPLENPQISSLIHDDHDHSQDKNLEKSKIYYTCSMHPQIREEKPGKCPICYMNLTKVELFDDDETTSNEVVLPPKKEWVCKNFPEVTSETPTICPLDGSEMIRKKSGQSFAETVAKVKLRKAQMRHFKPDLFLVTSMKMFKEIRLLGSVQQSETNESNIPARVAGRVEEVFIKSTGELVKKGAPVISIYSPTLITGGEEYLIARKLYEQRKGKNHKILLKESEQKLLLWGIKKFQMEKWFKRNKVPKSITLYSSTRGSVRKRNAIKGKYFKEGQVLFDLADLNSVWVEIDVYEHDAAVVKIGQNVMFTFSALPGKEWHGKIDFINPVLDFKTRTLKVRATLKNDDGKLMPGMVADSRLKIEKEGVVKVIPRTAVIDTGKRKVVWTKINEKLFQAKTIKTGFESQGFVEVSEGLMEGENVVIEGNFLLDAQAQLFGGYYD